MLKHTTNLLIAAAVFLSAITGAASLVLAGDNQINLWTNGELMPSVYAVLEENTTMVDLAALSDALGFEFANQGDRVSVSGRGRDVTATPGEGTILVNGHEILICPDSRQEDGKILIPIRVFLENMGYRVQWISRDVGVVLSPIEENTGISVTARRNQVKTKTFEADLQYPHISGLQPELEEPLNRYFEDRLSSLIDEGREAEKDLTSAEIDWMHATIASNYKVTSNEAGILSILLSDYIYSGGAHGMTTRTGVTVNIETGRIYEFKDIFKEESDYVDIINDEIKKQIDEKDITQDFLCPFETISSDQKFYVEDDNLVIFFDLYEYTPYAFGFPEFRIPLSLLGNVLSEEFAEIAKPLVQES